MPTETLEAPPFEITSQADLEALISEVAELDATAAKLDADYKSERAKLEARYAEARLLTVGRGRSARELTIEERRAEIVAAAAAWCAEHPEAWQAEDKKSRNYPAGTIGYRKEKDRVVVKDPDKREKLAAKWLRLALDWAARVVPFKTSPLTLNRLAIVEVKPAKTSTIEQLLKSGELKPKQLGMLGLEFQVGQEALFIDTKKRAVD